MTTTISYGITGFGGYVPRLRMKREAIAAAHRWMTQGGRAPEGYRAFCNWDEDSVTMAVEAARDALDNRPRSGIGTVALATTRPAFGELQAAAIVAGALDLPKAVRPLEIGQSQRAGVAGLLSLLRAEDGETLFIASDQPHARPGSAQEFSYGAGAAAFTLGAGQVLATLIGSASHSTLFVDHFRGADGKYDYYWEERWIRDEGYGRLVPATVHEALADAGVAPADVSHFIIGSPMRGVASLVAKLCGISPQAVCPELDNTCGYAGTAHGCVMLAHALERARPGEVIVLAGFAQGCDVIVLRATDAIGRFRPRRGVDAALADAQLHDAYLRMLSYRGEIDLEWGMRAEKSVKTAFTEQHRTGGQISAFAAGTCGCCGSVQFPQLAYCVQCRAPADGFVRTPLYDVGAKVLTSTADWLSYHPAPPLHVGFVQFDNGARVLMEMVDVGEGGVEVGAPLRMVFRIKDVDRERNYPRYFWKATPLAA